MNKIFIFFDIDGVLLNCHHDYKDPAIRRPWDDALKRNFGIEPNDLSRYFFNDNFIEVLKGEKDLKVSLAEALALIGYLGSVEEIVDCWFQSKLDINQQLLNYINLIKKNHNVNFYLATNQEKYRAHYLWQNKGLKSYFVQMFYSAELGYLKNNPIFFSLINQKLLINSKDTVLFFDDDINNVTCAKNFGWNAYLYESLSDFTDNPWIAPLLLK